MTARAAVTPRAAVPGRAVTAGHDRGSATVWVLGCCVLVLLVGSAAVLRAEAVLARHRAETAADFAALAAAGRIGVRPDICAAARRLASAGGATVVSCVPVVDAGGRSGTVAVRVSVTVHLPVVGARTVTADARAGRLPVADARAGRLPAADARAGRLPAAVSGAGDAAPGPAG